MRAGGIRQPGCRVGVRLIVTWRERGGPSHHPPAIALLRSVRTDSTGIARYIGAQASSDWIPVHRLWGEWPPGGRVRTLAPMAEKR